MLVCDKPEFSTFQVHLPAQSTIADLKNIIQDSEGYSSTQEFDLLSHDGGRRLYETFSLAAYNLESGSHVHVIWKTCGRGGAMQSFVDMENTSSLKTHKIESATLNTPIWNIVSHGLNIRGICQNVECEAHGKNVWCQKGYTVFNIAEPVECPSCMKKFCAATCGFMRCEWMFEGRKRGDSVDVTSEWTVTMEADFQWFDDHGGRNTVDWSCLARRLASARRTGCDCMEYVSETDCVLCFGPANDASTRIANDGHGAMRCGHVVHLECERVCACWLQHLSDVQVALGSTSRWNQETKILRELYDFGYWKSTQRVFREWTQFMTFQLQMKVSLRF